MPRLKYLIPALLLGLTLTACRKEDDDMITVDIGVLSASYESVSSVHDLLRQWENEHPDISVIERGRIRDEDFMNLGELGTYHLPDVFITDYLNGRVLEEEGLVMDISEFSYPVMNENMAVIVFDPDLWEDEDPIGFCSDRRHPETDYINLFLADPIGQEFISHMEEGDMEASFTDSQFTDILEKVQERMRYDIPFASEEDLSEAFINGGCSAALVSGDDLYLFLKNIRDNNPSLYGRIDFRNLGGGSIPHEFQYGIFINAGLQGEKLDSCIDLAGSLSGRSTEFEDETFDRLNALIDDSDGVRLFTLNFSPLFWVHAYEECFYRLAHNEITAKTCAYMLQDLYEQYYLVM